MADDNGGGPGPFEFTADEEKAMRDRSAANHQSSAANPQAYQGGWRQKSYLDPTTGKTTYGPREPLMVEPIPREEF